jgi:ribose transport system substrate-binding protein
VSSRRMPGPAAGRPVRTAACGLSAVLMSVVLAACGSSSADSTSTAASASPIVSTCKSMLAKYSELPQFTDPGPAIPAAQVKGKTVAIIAQTQAIPALAEVATGAQQAAAAAGLKTTFVNGDLNLSKLSQGIQQAIDQHADAVILDGVDPTLVTKPIASLKAAGIPMDIVLANEPVKGAPGQGSPNHDIDSTSAPSYSTAGELMACAAIVDTGGKADVAIMSTASISAAANIVQGVKKILAQCEGCQIATETQTPVETWTTTLPGLTSNLLRKDPKINYLLPVFDNMAMYVVTGARQSGTTVPAATFNGSPAVLSIVKKGGGIAADPGQSNAWLGWHSVDQVMRAMLDEPPADPEVPIRYFDTANLTDVDETDGSALYGSSFVDGYKKLWGLG